MNDYAFFKKKQEKDNSLEILLMAQILWLMQTKQNQYWCDKVRLHQLIAYLFYKKVCRLQKIKLKNAQWYHLTDELDKNRRCHLHRVSTLI